MKVVLVAAAGCCDCCFHCFPFVSCHKAKRGSGVSLVKNQRKNFFSDFSKIFSFFCGGTIDKAKLLFSFVSASACFRFFSFSEPSCYLLILFRDRKITSSFAFHASMDRSQQMKTSFCSKSDKAALHYACDEPHNYTVCTPVLLWLKRNSTRVERLKLLRWVELVS